MTESLETDQINRIWDFRLHVVDTFYNRLNFFLVFESVLLGVVGLLYSRPNPTILMLKIIGILGLCLTLIWGYIQARHKYVFNDLTAYVKELVPEYRTILERRARVKWPLSSMWLLAYVVPTLVGLVWLAFLIFS